MTDATLLECLEQLGALANLVGAVGARLAGEFAARSQQDVAEPLAKRLGNRTAPVGVAAIAHVSAGAAADWCRVGEQLRVRRTLTGDVLPEQHPAVAAAVDSGSVCTEGAALILSTLQAVADKAGDPERLTAWEEFLVQEALAESVAGLRQACRALLVHADPGGVEPREQELRAKAETRVIKRRDGMTAILTEADPESAGWILTALDARTAPRREVRFDDGDDVDSAVQDTRTAGQKRLDALVSMARDSLKHDAGDMSGTAVTLLVTVNHDALVSGVGSAMISGIDEPISAVTARRLACEARILPVVLGGASQPLDLGEGRRLFSEAQRYAMAVRDGGCIWPGCGEPPGRCEAAHLKAWHQGAGDSRGPTNLDNGVLLCRFHHRRLDNDGWAVEVRGGTPYLIPPPWIDPTRTPRRAGRPRLDGAA